MLWPANKSDSAVVLACGTPWTEPKFLKVYIEITLKLNQINQNHMTHMPTIKHHVTRS